MRRLIAGIAGGLFVPTLLMVALFAFVQTVHIENDAGSALIMAGFFYGAPVACILGFLFGIVMGDK
jgi:hypothetical protein